MRKSILFFFVICLTSPQLIGVEKNSFRKNSYTPQRQAGDEPRRAYEPFKELEMKRAEEERPSCQNMPISSTQPRFSHCL